MFMNNADQEDQMADDNYVREALMKVAESDVEKRVYEKIKGDLFRLKFIGGLAGVSIAVLLAFHQPIFTFVVNRGGEEFRDTIKRSLETEETSFKEMLADIKARRAIAAEDLKRLRDDIVSRYDDALKIKAEIDQEKDKLDNLIKQYRETAERVQVNVERVATAQSTASLAVDRAERAMVELAALLKNQNTIIQELQKKNVVSPSVVALHAQSTVTDTPKPTIYFQFAGFAREEAVAISNDIAKTGWRIPGQERTSAAVNTNQIRFNSTDRNTAEQLKKDTDAVLQARGLDISLLLQENPKVKPGIPEIWIYKP